MVKRIFSYLVTVAVFNLILVTSGFCWGSATHAFMVRAIGRWNIYSNFQEMYGMLAPDLFNYNFDLSGDQALRAFTHGLPGQEGFMAVWEKARWIDHQKSLAMGFVAHNDLWGVDSTAHHRALTITPPADFPRSLEPGYIIIKAHALNSDSTMDHYFSSQGLSNDHPEHFALRVEICHQLVECAGDLIIRRIDPRIGEKIIVAAVTRSRSFPELLIRAFNNAEYSKIIRENEWRFRRAMIQYGAILTRPEPEAFIALAEEMAELGVEYLKKFAGIEVSSDLALEITRYGIRKAIELCARDYVNEIKKTIENVRNELKNHLVSTD
ncbi:MAG: hypothetical protein WBI18_00825 [Candidatus Saccharicenans sp.]